MLEKIGVIGGETDVVRLCLAAAVNLDFVIAATASGA